MKTRHPFCRRGASPDCGFTLIEVLITMFVIGVGLLAVAGLQAMSRKFSYDAVQRTSASALAQAMVENLRGNPSQLGAYVTADASSVTAGADCAVADAQCSPAQLARYELYRWGRALEGVEASVDGAAVCGLVAPTGCIATSGTPRLYVVAVAWRGVTGLDPPDASDPADDPARDICGLNLGRYDDPLKPGTDDRLRRILLLEAFVDDPDAS